MPPFCVYFSSDLALLYGELKLLHVMLMVFLKSQLPLRSHAHQCSSHIIQLWFPTRAVLYDASCLLCICRLFS